MHKKKRLLALFMTFVLLFSSGSFAVSAESAPAAAPTRVAEVETLRETNSETYLMSDGTYECVVYAYDKYFKDANNTLQLVDNKIIPADTAERTTRITTGATQYKNTANAFDVHFSGNGVPEVSVAYSGASITFSPINSGKNTSQNAVFSVGSVANCKPLSDLTYTGDNTVTYSGAFPNADLVYVLENNALKEYIILNNANAGNAFSFLLTLDGVTLNSMDKYAELVDENGTTLFALDSLFAVDADGAFTEALTYSFVPVKGTSNVIVTITLDESYLSSADRAYPVIIDPTVMISSTETADACVCSYTPTTNYQGASQLRTGFDTDYGIRRSYIKFNIPSSIPAGGVTEARIEIEKLSGVDPTIYACRVTNSWSSGTITWNNKASYTIVNASSTSVIYSTGSSWHKMNVTSIVQSWVNGTYTNYGFVLLDETENNSNHWTTLYSSDAPSPHKPELHIVYSESSGNDSDENIPTRSIRLYGVTNAGHDHASSLRYVSNLLDSYGYTDNALLTGYFHPDTFKAQLKAARIVTTRSHGYIVTIDSAVFATGLLLNDGSTGNKYYIINRQCALSGAAYTYIADSDVFTSLDLALFIGCETALTGTDQSNFAKRIFEQGARVTVGFEDSIYCDPSNDWTEMFYECFLAGNSVSNAVDYASLRVTALTGLRSATIYGDEEFTIN